MISEKGDNRGIIVTGGHFEAKTAVAGDNARGGTTLYQGGDAITLEQLRAEIDRLVDSYQRAKAELSKEEEQTLAQIRSEAQKPRPIKAKLSSLLEQLGSGAKSVGSIATAITAVGKLVELLVL